MGKKAMHGLDVTDHLSLYTEFPGVFHVLGYKPTSGAVYLLRNPHGNKLVLAHNQVISASNLDVYDVKLGAIDGLSIGFLFHSPLALKGDFYYLLFYRKSLNPMRDIVEHNMMVGRRLVARNVVFHSSPSAHYMVIKGAKSQITSFLAEG